MPEEFSILAELTSAVIGALTGMLAEHGKSSVIQIIEKKVLIRRIRNRQKYLKGKYEKSFEPLKKLDKGSFFEWLKEKRTISRILSFCNAEDTGNINIEQMRHSKEVFFTDAFHMAQAHDFCEKEELRKVLNDIFLYVDELFWKTLDEKDVFLYKKCVLEIRQLIREFTEEIIREIQYHGSFAEYTKYRYTRKTIIIMTSIMKTGNYVWSYEPSILTSSIPEGLNRILVDYLNHRLAQGCRTTTLSGIKPKIKHFLLYVASLGFDDLTGLEISDINSYLPVLADSYGNVGDSLSLLRSFGAYLSENSLCSLNLETIFTIKVPNRKKIHSGFDKDEVTAILNAPDRNTALGKRDYAIIMLAAHTGLRGVDVLTLRFSDIDWRLREIRLIQSKTSKPVMLPVPVAVLNAVAEYILEARPENTANIKAPGCTGKEI